MDAWFYSKKSIDEKCYGWAHYEYTLLGWHYKYYFENSYINRGSGTIVPDQKCAIEAVDTIIEQWNKQHCVL